ncbi:MAG: LysM peptidoglycan-binding domain-containing protein, partial [Bacillota bacterium]
MVSKLVNLIKKPLTKITIAIAVALLAIGWVASIVMASTGTYVLEVNGRALGVVHGKTVVRSALASLKNEAAKQYGRTVSLGRQVALVRYASDKDAAEAGVSQEGADQTGAGAKGQPTLAELSDEAAVLEALSGLSPLVVDGFMIRVEGEDVVGLLSKDEAQAVVDELKAEEAARIQKRGASVSSLEIVQEVTVEAAAIPLDKLRAKDEAKRILARGTDRVETYVVSRGDSLWAIASKHGMTVDTLIKANPDLPKSLTINPGQKLNLIAATPYIDIVSVEIKTVKERIPFPVEVVEDASLWPWQVSVRQAGVSGQKEVTYRTERQTSSRQQKTSVVSENILSEPKLQIE